MIGSNYRNSVLIEVTLMQITISGDTALKSAISGVVSVSNPTQTNNIGWAFSKEAG